MTPRIEADGVSAPLPSYGIRKVHAAIAADPALADAEITLIDHAQPDLEAYVRSIVAFEPDVVGFSIYVWSMALLIDVARRVREALGSDVTIVFGGPSAHSAVFALRPYADALKFVDAVVPNEGEGPMRAIVSSRDRSRQALSSIAGLEVATPLGFRRTHASELPTDLDVLASPYELGLMQKGDVGYLETFRGCPLSCRFCEWGSSDGSMRLFSEDYLRRELARFRAHDVPGIYLLDAGLNLNTRAFRNFEAAEREEGIVRDTAIWCEFYPSYARDDQLEFLRRAGPSTRVGIGVQTYNREVLRLHQRPIDPATCESVIQELARITEVELEIIMGLPGDSPDSFRRTLDRALSLSVGVRVYHCLVLPDALLTRSPPEFALDFDPIDLAMISCWGWSRDDIQRERERLSTMARESGGDTGRFWWSFPGRQRGSERQRSYG